MADGSARVDGLLSLAEFAERFGIGGDEEEYETIGGFVFGRLGRAPQVGDAVVVGDYRLEVAALDHLRIARVRVVRQLVDGADPDEAERLTHKSGPPP